MKLIKSDALKISLLYFVFTRITLLIIGYCATSEFALHAIVKPAAYKSYDDSFFSIFGTYDSGWYLKIARDWYPDLNSKPAGYIYQEYSFFPLYPALIRLVKFITCANYFFSGLIISNASLIISGCFLYKISEKYYNKNIAEWSTIFMYTFPVSFIFSGIFSESLYLMLILMTIYYSSLGKWVIAGIAALFLTLCRPIGVFVIFPLLLMFIKNNHFSLTKFNKNIFGLLLVFAGVLILSIHHYIFSGREFSVFSLYGSDYKIPFTNPIKNFYSWFISDYFTMSFLATFTLVVIICWILFYKHINLQFHIIILYSLLIPMCYTMMSMPRMCLVAFPFFIQLSSIASKYKIQHALLISCVLFQGYLFVCWCLGFGNVI